MKAGDLYIYTGRPSKNYIACYEVDFLNKLYNGERYTNNDFSRFGSFIGNDYILITGEILHYHDSYASRGDNQITDWTLPVFLNLTTMKRFVFKLNAAPEKILRKIDMEENGQL